MHRAYHMVCYRKPASPSWDGGDEQMSERGSATLVSALVRTEIVPKLVARHGSTAQSPSVRAATEDVRQLADSLRSEDPAGAIVIVQRLINRGAAIETLFLDLFAPTADRLGELWLDDRCTFADASVAMSRLHVLVRQLASTTEWPRARDRNLLLAPAPGEQHVFGLTLLEPFLVRAGWDVIGAAPTSIASLVQRRSVRIVGFSASSESRLEGLEAVIRDVRTRSQNPELIVLVGGRCFNERPELVAQVGADATATHAAEIVDVANDLTGDID